jgi:hypothetical protein
VEDFKKQYPALYAKRSEHISTMLDHIFSGIGDRFRGSSVSECINSILARVRSVGVIQLVIEWLSFALA